MATHLKFLTRTLLPLLLVSGSCRTGRVNEATSELAIHPDRIDFAQTFPSQRRTSALNLSNTGLASVNVTLTVETPFDAPATLQLGPGENLEVEIGATPTQLGTTEGNLTVEANGIKTTVALSIETVAVPACPPRDCHTAIFNIETSICEETVDLDGTSCGASNQCLFDGVCQSGQCVGRSRDCNDDNACTTDACEPTTGCAHAAVMCPASIHACEQPICSPTTGCGVAPAVDGVSCGPNDCQTAQVCISGQCVSRPAPDGSICAPATSCRGPGVCENHQCAFPRPTPLMPSWRYSPEPGRKLVFLGHVDDQGNLYATEIMSPTPRRSSSLGDEDPKKEPETCRTSDPLPPPPQEVTSVLSLSPTGMVRFRRNVAFDCDACRMGLEFTIDSANRLMFFSAKGQTIALSTYDGLQLWAAATAAGIPPNDLRADGGTVVSAEAPFLVGPSVVAVPIMEGDDDHHSYVKAFDRQTGAFRWQFHRKGHFYGMGVAGDELWTSSADCWAVAGEMARMDQQGQVGLTRFVEWIPSIYEPESSVGIARGKLHRLDFSFNLTDLSPLPPSDQVLATSSRMVLFYQGALQSVSFVNNGLNEFTYRGVVGFRPDFELLSSGKTGWTASLPPFTIPVAGGYLGAIDAAGQEIFNCPLATNAESRTAIIKGRAYMASEGDIVAYDVPGLDVAPDGWVSRRGSLGR